MNFYATLSFSTESIDRAIDALNICADKAGYTVESVSERTMTAVVRMFAASNQVPSADDCRIVPNLPDCYEDSPITLQEVRTLSHFISVLSVAMEVEDETNIVWWRSLTRTITGGIEVTWSDDKADRIEAHRLRVLKEESELHC